MGDQSLSDVRITYQQPGTNPPIFVAGSFTSPPWEPQEMKYVKKVPGSGKEAGEETAECELEFFGDYKIGEGNYQYKFRIGHGDWWVCDESVGTTTDDGGNRNNVLIVQSRPVPSVSGPIEPVEAKDEVKASDKPSEDSRLTETDQALSSSSSPRLEFAPLFPYESGEVSKMDDGYEAAPPNSPKDALPDSRLPTIVDDSIIESFPVEKEKILQQIETTKLRVQEDETTPAKGSPASPSINSRHGLATPPSSNDISPALISISEEDLDEIPEAHQTLSNGTRQRDGAQESDVVDKTPGDDHGSSTFLAKDVLRSPTPSTNPTDKDKNENFLQSLVRQLLIASALVLIPAAALYWRAQQ